MKMIIQTPRRMIEEQRARQGVNTELARKLVLVTGVATVFILLARLFLFWLRSSPT
jgi:hypothetical protein